MFRGKKIKILSGWSGFFLGVAIVFFGIVSYIAIGNTISQATAGPSSKADGFTIGAYHVDLDVKEDGKIDVDETVYIDFYEGGHHGIYRFIPEWLKYTSKDGKTSSRKGVITNLRCENETYTVDTVKRKKRIKIGKSYHTLSEGTYRYDISYTYDMGKDPYNGFDEFIFHAFGDYWGTPIKAASVTVNLPKNFDPKDTVYFFADKKRKDDITSHVKYVVDGSTLYARVNSDYDLTKSLTVDIELPEGYFVGGADNYDSSALLSLLICIAYAGIIYLLWYRFGKDLPKEPETVEFYPPYNLDAAQIGYLYVKDAGKKLAISLIVELASKGYLEILNTSRKDKLKVKKTEKAVDDLTKNELLVYNKLFEDGDEIVLKDHKNFHKVYSQIAESVREEFQDKINDIASYRVKFLTSATPFWIILIWFITYKREMLNPAFSIFYVLSYAAIVVSLVCIYQMHRKSTYGEVVAAKINGFRNYLEVAEKDRIDMLVEENPNYFFNILPYAYVLGVSKKWIEKFPIPEGEEYAYVEKIDKIYDALAYTDGTATRSSGSSSGCSSCGGGCSSCGGGCSSCGGGGSW
ncbi:MAG: DUF2207 domain-containing protein [Pseudobutyrivibrio sp.]|nr:DUF2207 domain-containing protein [Pseudobutyrivibrio sp.]